MSLHLPSRRVIKPAASLASSATPYTFLVPCLQRRTVWGIGWMKKAPDTTPPLRHSLSEEYLRKKPTMPDRPIKGDLSPSSIFQDKEIAGTTPLESRDRRNMAGALDPDPERRQRWERKMVIRQITKRGRLTKAQLLKQQERQLLSKSHDFKTSVKKLNPLGRQIVGKTIEDAIVQMRFSKKKAARDVLEHLEHAKNEAIVRRGMGLGGEEKKLAQPVTIITNKKKRVKVVHPTTIYVDQAWVGKGLYGESPDYRARGQMNIMKNRTTSLSVILKEETTRIRLHREREEKFRNRKVWVQLPNRPITAQRQHYSW